MEHMYHGTNLHQFEAAVNVNVVDLESVLTNRRSRSSPTGQIDGHQCVTLRVKRIGTFHLGLEVSPTRALY